MEDQNSKRNDGSNGRNNCKSNWMTVAIAGAVMLAALVCGGCLYTAIPAMAGPSTTYPQAANSQPSPASQPSQPSNDQTNQSNQNKQQNGMPPNGAQPQGQGGTL